MIANGTGVPIGDLAQRLIEVVAQLGLTTPRGRRRNGDLKEIEYFTLSILRHHDTLIVGDIQRQLGVLPAQMSRIIRSLEDRDHPLIACRINSRDKRKIDVALTPAGVAAYDDYQATRVQVVAGLLSRLPEEDLDDLHRLLERAQELLLSQDAG
ncbi:MAG TPA: MarR family transcriptional regulator [Gemmataceae bacterium]|nr:MarR family transcriptional regulator [Gemmataceae bacterium]